MARRASVLCVALSLVVAPWDSNRAALGSQEPDRTAGEESESRRDSLPGEREDLERQVDMMVQQVLEHDLDPIPPTPIPDDPPPHEGAMISLPYTLEPPDFIMVEVLEALPGRPLSGVRLIRPDGTITLGFYGDVNVRGLTRDQAKAKIILRLRKFLTDEVLGLLPDDPDYVEETMPQGAPEPPLPSSADELPSSPTGLRSPQGANLPSRAGRGAAESARRLPRMRATRSNPASRIPARPSHPARPRQAARPRAVRLTGQASESMPGSRSEASPPPVTREAHPAGSGAPTPAAAVMVPPGSSIKITIEVITPQPGTSTATPQGGEKSGLLPTLPEEAEKSASEGRSPERPSDTARIRPIHPFESDRVYVDFDSFNSKHYYILGDVALPGRYPWTGNETVLDATTFGGGFIPQADPKDIYLYRPARGGKPARKYHIDWEGIQKGDAKANLQLFPNDRLVVGRNAVVKATAELNRLAEPTHLVWNEIITFSSMIKNLNAAVQSFAPPSYTISVDLGKKKIGLDITNKAPALTAEQMQTILRDWAKYWWRAAEKGASIDEKTLREGMIRRLVPPPPKRDDEAQDGPR